MGMQAKTVNLLLYDGSLQGVLGIEDSSWNSGEMYSAPREAMRDLLKTDACNRYGVYLLLSRDRVYVGQSSDLSRRLSQHVSGKDWWDSVVILTTKDDSLNHTDIDYLESRLIDRARATGSLDCDNKNRGNPPKADRFRSVFLDQYLEEALFLMEFIGIPVFSDRAKDDRPRKLVDVTDVGTRLAIGKRVKSLAIGYVREHGVDVGKAASYAVLKGDGSDYWLNPSVTMLAADWHLVLNDTRRRELVVLRVPAHALRMRSEREPGLAARRDKPHYIDLHIRADDLVDRRSGTDFSAFLSGRVAY